MRKKPITGPKFKTSDEEACCLKPSAAALKMRIPSNRLNGILKCQQAITPDTALRLARLFGSSAEMWLNLQLKYDLQIAEDELAQRIEREVETLGGEAA